ncbi:MAG: methyltransferase [Thermodesulfobacteriota bacterium]
MPLSPGGDFQELLALARGFQAAKMLMAAVDLAVFDFLEEPRRADAAASWLKADDRATGIFLNGLAALGLLVKEADRFRNSGIASRYLVQGKDDYRGAIIKHMEHTWDRGWNDLQNTVIVGRPGEADPEKWLDAKPERDEKEVRAFICGMDAIARDLAPQVTAALDLKNVSRLLDLGGGPATYAMAFARSNPQLRATVFDLPRPITIAREQIARQGLEDRIQTLAGNFLEDDIGRGYDFIWVSQILHSHDEKQCRLILDKCVRALDAGGTLAIHDFYLNQDGVSPPGAAMFGVHMLAVTPRGRAYTWGEVAAWMGEAGLAAAKHIRYNGGEASILVAPKK